MLPRQTFRAALAAAAVLSLSPANAQFYNNGCSSCGPVTAPAAACVPIQPVQAACYQTVPVTTYQREKQTVREPYYKTEYEDREVTVMRPVTVQREIEVPTISYRNVTEYRTVQRDMGRWVTRYIPVQKASACQVDSRPGLIGWLNRTGYSFRTAFMPNYYTSRQYVPRMMACTVPVTRQVAVRGTRRVTVAETRMVAEKRRERVAVQKLAWRERVVSVLKPQVAYRTVPIGTQTAYSYGFGYGTAAAFAPTIIDSRTALNPEPDPISSARADDEDERGMFPDDREPSRRAESPTPFRGSGHTRELEPADDDDFLLEPQARRRTPETDLIVPAVYSRPVERSTTERSTTERSTTERSTTERPASGWKRTTRKTVMRSSRADAPAASQVALTQPSED